MKPETEQNLATLEMLTDGLYCSSVGTEPYGIILWEVEEKGEFSFSNFLIEVKALTPLEVAEFQASLHRTQSKETVRQYEELVNLLQSNLSQLQFYSYDAPYLSEKHTSMYAPYQNIASPLIIGFTPRGEWLAMAPTRSSQTESAPPQFAIPSLEPTETTANLIDRIEIISGDLPPKTARNEFRKNKAKWKVVVTSNPSNAIEKVLDFGGYLNVFKTDELWKLEDLEDAGKYYSLWELKEFNIQQFFKRKLIGPRAYSLYFDSGEYQVHYVLGKNKNGDWLCAFTDTFSW